MASNVRAVPDITDFEDYPDWLELKNTGNSTVSLDGYFLSDSPSNPFKWGFPTGASIPANGFLLIMADGHDAAPGQTFPRGYWPWKSFVTEKYHANFRLAATGETLSLSRVTGISSVSLVNASTPAPVPPATVAIWKYKDDGSDQGSDWRKLDFDDSAWAAGPAKLGYGDSGEGTTVSYGPSESNKYITTYFRHHFSVQNPGLYHGLTIRLLVDDGCVIYLNGTEVVRRNMPEGDVNYKTLAMTAVGGTDETTFFTYHSSSAAIIPGDNVLAVEVHQGAVNSSDLGFDLGLTADSHTGFDTIDAVTYTQQVPDVSLGRDTADPLTWKQFAEPTPGEENTSAIVENIRIAGNVVEFSLPGGVYDSDQSVSLSSPSGTIHYTLNGSDPTGASPVYSNAIPITATTVVRARCFENGKAPGPIATRTYFRGETQGNIPYVSVVADPETLFGSKIGIYANEHESTSPPYNLHDVYKEKDAPGNIEFFAPDGSGFSTECGIRIGGENNWVHPQKALNIFFQGKYGNDNVTYDLFPDSRLPVYASFTLRDGGDNWASDMLREALYAKLAHGYLAADTSDYRPAIVFINGEYYGIHNVRQRWDETWFAEQYHLQADQIDHLLYGHVGGPNTTLGVDKGSASDWLDLLSFIDTADLRVQTNWDYVESHIDMDSFMDFVISESYGNNIAWHHNREFWKAKTIGAKWHWFLPDMDRTFHTSAMSGVLSDMLANDDVLRRVKLNVGFKERLAQRYAAHMAATFKPSRVQSIISQMDDEVAALVPRHAARWAPYGATVSSHASGVQEIKDYAAQRAANFAAELSSDLGVGTTVPLTLNHDPLQGIVLVEGVPVEPSTFELFRDIPFTLKAVPAPGYAFSGWTGTTGGDSITVTLSAAQAITANFVSSGEMLIGGALASDTTLTLANSPYALSSDLVVPPGITLTVEAGVTINMPANRNIRVQGVLDISGTAEQPIKIQGRNGERWGGISFEEPAEPSSLAHLIIRGATKGYDPTIYNCAISGHNATVTMDFLDITDSEEPVYFFGGSCTVRDSTLYSPYVGDAIHVKQGTALIQRCVFPGNNAPDTDAVDFDGVTNGVVEDCRIYRFQGFNSDGIDLGEGAKNIIIQGNLIYYNADKGVSVGQGTTVTMRKNLIVGCAMGVGIKDFGSSAIIDQNTFVACGSAVAVYEKNFGAGGGSAAVTNCIISKSTEAPVTVDGLSTLSLAYNLSDTEPLPGSNNVLADPRFVDPNLLNFQVQPDSPAIDAGDPAHAPDPDNTRADIGAEYTYNASDYPYSIGQTVVINEVLANSGAASDWIELHNRTHSPIDIGGWFLSDSATDLQKYRIPLGTVISGDGFLVFYENANFGAASTDTNKITGFALNDTGEAVYLSSAVDDQLTDYQTRQDFGPSLPGETLGRYYKQSSDSYNFVAMAAPTPGASNSAPRVGPIVISEIMYNPAGAGNGDAEYFELVNVSDADVTLYDAAKQTAWRMSNGIEFEFPSATPIAMRSGERILLVKDIAAFTVSYGGLVPSGVRILEWNAGSLDNRGETLQLDRPGPTNDLGVVQYVREDRVNYDGNSPWPVMADGKGSSLTKIAEGEYGNDFANWTAASPTPGAPSSQSATDSDGDGMPDAYELANGLNPANPNDAALDADGDGESNLDEYLAGTNPTDPGSVLELDSVEFSQGQIVIYFHAVAGRTYTILSSSDLTNGWAKVTDVPAQPANTAVMITEMLPSLETPRFFRLVTPALP
ncbi:MAG: lamin tail domain-containing protein [Candidatus Omnitrophica bacterium]|nr:lamin tail domain-containing protein [Candidatus Omnitrophota bacterium]